MEGGLSVMAACFTYKQHATVSEGGIEGGSSVLFASRPDNMLLCVREGWREGCL